jgi:hypothetical protein
VLLSGGELNGREEEFVPSEHDDSDVDTASEVRVRVSLIHERTLERLKEDGWLQSGYSSVETLRLSYTLTERVPIDQQLDDIQ